MKLNFLAIISILFFCGASNAQVILSEDIDAPLILEKIDMDKGEAIFLITRNVAGILPTDQSVLWYGDKVLADFQHKKGIEFTRQDFCVSKIITINNAKLEQSYKQNKCLGGITEWNGAQGLPLNKMKVGTLARFQPFSDLKREILTNDERSKQRNDQQKQIKTK